MVSPKTTPRVALADPLPIAPLGNVSLPIGVHEIVFSYPQLGERRQSVTVTRSGVNRVSVDFQPTLKSAPRGQLYFGRGGASEY